MTNHKSHHIFIYLGILIAIFILFFGFNYFKSLYNFNETTVVVSDQDYDNGALTESPFVPVEEEVAEVDPFGVKKNNDNCFLEDDLLFCVDVIHSNDPNRPTPKDVSITVRDTDGNSQKIYSIENLGMSLRNTNYLDILSVEKLNDDMFEIIYVEGLSGYGEGNPQIIEYSKSMMNVKNNDNIETIVIQVPKQFTNPRVPNNPKNYFGILMVDKEVPKTTSILDSVYRQVFQESFNGISYKKVIFNDGVAKLYLTGKWISAGIGSQPMFRDTVTKATFQFQNVEMLEVFLNNKRWDWCIDSEKDGPCEPRYWIATEPLFEY